MVGLAADKVKCLQGHTQRQGLGWQRGGVPEDLRRCACSWF